MSARFMQAALAFARRGLGISSPNPTVGALIVDETRDPPVVLARGRTARGGRPHAEAIAIDAAGERAKGATLYVTLEPCAQRSSRDFGASCTDLIIKSGIARVVIGARDPSPFAAGEGVMRLQAAGIAVEAGLLEAASRALNLGHIRRVSAQRPFVQVKLAQTADGFAGTLSGGRLAITGEASRGYVHRLRAEADAILTGIGTVLADDPLLNVRLPGMEDRRVPRIVLDTKGRMPSEARMLRASDPAGGPVLIATAHPERLAPLAGLIEIIAVPMAENGHLDLAALLGALAARGLTRVMLEAGPRLANGFAQAGLIDELVLLTGPDSVGAGILALGPELRAVLAGIAPRETRKMGADVIEIFEVQK
jgi:diaminohydroxyphosphoribosylaminopyrimidine deaminase / 5-amino-6-(5-phosphoribosylamino)uracil reductase